MYEPFANVDVFMFRTTCMSLLKRIVCCYFFKYDGDIFHVCCQKSDGNGYIKESDIFICLFLSSFTKVLI